MPASPSIGSQRIAERKLKVAMITADSPPFLRADAQGRLHGLDPWLAQDIAKELGVGLEIVRTAPTYDKLVASVARREADLGISFLSITRVRARRPCTSRGRI